MLLLLGTLLAFIPISLAVCPADTNYETYFNKCYKYYNTPMTFLAAEKQCNSIGGNLAAIQNPIENGYVSGIASGASGHTPNFWIGANQLMAASWAWTYNTPMSFTNWATGQPGASYPCGLIRDSDSKWITGACNSALPFVCTVDPNADNNQPGYCPTSTQQTATTCPSAIMCPNDAACTDGYKLFAGNCMCYKDLSIGGNFNESIATCANDSATLVKIDTPELNDFLHSMGYYGGPWTGLQCLNSLISSCYWLDGTIPIYTNFENGRPENSYRAYFLESTGTWYPNTLNGHGGTTVFNQNIVDPDGFLQTKRAFQNCKFEK